MTESQFELIALVLKLIAERDDDNAYATELIFEAIRDPLMLTMIDVINATEENVTWVDIELRETLLAITFSAKYNSHDDIPAFMNTLFPTSADKLIRSITIGIPVALVASPPDVIKSFLLNTIDNAMSKQQKSKIDLTPQQELFLLMVKQTYRGGKH